MAAPKKTVGPKSDKLWSDAIRIAALEAAGKGKPKKLRAAATKLVNMAVKGDLAAMKEMGDRLEGKPVQGVAVGGPDGGAIEIEYLSLRESVRRLLSMVELASQDQPPPT